MITAEYIAKVVTQALAEDIASGDITAELIGANVQASGRIVTREDGILCGTAFALEAFQQIDPSCHVEWAAQDGDAIAADSLVCTLSGPARALLTGERTALNFLQLLSGTASTAGQYAARVAHTGVKLLDTRKTVPGLRLAQKYAVACGGCYNHRIGLFDAFLIKETHISAAGGIAEAIDAARNGAPDKPVEVEVENEAELEQAEDIGALASAIEKLPERSQQILALYYQGQHATENSQLLKFYLYGIHKGYQFFVLKMLDLLNHKFLLLFYLLYPRMLDQCLS